MIAMHFVFAAAMSLAPTSYIQKEKKRLKYFNMFNIIKIIQTTRILPVCPPVGTAAAAAARYSLVLLAVVGEDEVLQLHLDLDPLLVGERRPDVVRLRHGRLVRLQHHLRPVVVDVQRAQDEDEARERLQHTPAAPP